MKQTKQLFMIPFIDKRGKETYRDKRETHLALNTYMLAHPLVEKTKKA